MSFYCGCRVRTNKNEVALEAATDEERDTGVILPRVPMTVMKTGVPQFLPSGGQHYPYVDVLECEACGRRMVRE